MKPLRTWVNIVVEMLPVVKPHFGEASIVVVHDSARAPGERIGRCLAEHVPHVRTRSDLERAPAHPHLPRSPFSHICNGNRGLNDLDIPNIFI